MDNEDSKKIQEELEKLKSAFKKAAKLTPKKTVSSEVAKSDVGSKKAQKISKKPAFALTVDVEKEENPDLLYQPIINDEKAYNLVQETARDHSFAQKIKDAFIKNYHNFGFASNAHNLSESNIEITTLNAYLGKDKGVNSSSHFVINDSENNKTYHVKAALHGSGISLGTKFNEVAFYKLNEEMKVGPRCGGILSRAGILMIVNENLGSRSIGNAKNKKISFKDNEASFKKGVATKENIVLEIPEREKENIHRCVVEMMINLCFYADVQRNYANTGFKETTKTYENGSEETKRKPFIIDFRLAGSHDLSLKFNDGKLLYEEISQLGEIKKYSDIIASKIKTDPTAKKTPPIRKDILEFEETPKVFQESLKKLFFNDKTGEATKFHSAITKSFNYAEKMSGLSIKDAQNHQRALSLQERKLTAHINKFLENPDIQHFFAQEKEKFLSTKEDSISQPTATLPEATTPSKAPQPENIKDQLVSRIHDFVTKGGRK